jgi:hypothetical protein
VGDKEIRRRVIGARTPQARKAGQKYCVRKGREKVLCLDICVKGHQESNLSRPRKGEQCTNDPKRPLYKAFIYKTLSASALSDRHIATLMCMQCAHITREMNYSDIYISLQLCKMNDARASHINAKQSTI